MKSSSNKSISCLLCLILSLALTACAPSAESGSADLPDVLPPTSEISSEPVEGSEESPAPAPDSNAEVGNITGLCGEELSLKFDEHLNDTMDMIESPRRFYVYEDFGYYVPSDGRVVYKHEANYDSIIYDGAAQRLEKIFHRLNKGEELRSLTLESAKGVLEVDENGETQFTRQWLDFSGSITLDGFIYICSDEEGYFGENDVIFLAGEGEWAGLPYNGNYMSYTMWGTDSKFFWCATAPVIHLGNLSDYDFFSLPDNRGKVSEATVTIGSLSLRNDLCDFAYSFNWDVSTGVIEDIEFK